MCVQSKETYSVFTVFFLILVTLFVFSFLFIFFAPKNCHKTNSLEVYYLACAIFVLSHNTKFNNVFCHFVACLCIAGFLLVFLQFFNFGMLFICNFFISISLNNINIADVVVVVVFFLFLILFWFVQ